MSVIAEALAAARANLDVQAAGIEYTKTLIKEVKQLLLEDNTTAALELLDEIEAVAPEAADAIMATEELIAQVDAVNGEPAPVDVPVDAPVDAPVEEPVA